mmetsp:Transcript_11549/g.17229  ORF Transcript_11549/g.17229 Transcript_11549/m.17229 type:complete len:634 (-) Transcript_11549:243-2144(-)
MKIVVFFLVVLAPLGEPLIPQQVRRAKTILSSTTTYPSPSSPQQGSDSYVHNLADSAQFFQALEETDGLVVIKFFAPWCRACRGLEPKYKRLSIEYFKKGDVTFFEMSHKDLAANEPEFLQQQEVNVLPLIQFYHNAKRVESFPCGPRKIEVLREKLEIWHTKLGNNATESISKNYKTETSKEKEETRQMISTTKTSESSTSSSPFSSQQLDAIMKALRNAPLFQNVDDANIRALVRESRMAHYDAGDPLVVEGEMGRRFFVLLEGECDVYKQDMQPRLTGFSPTQSAYGQILNTLKAGAYFGERALVENAPRVVSIVAATAVSALAIERQALETAGIDLTSTVQDQFRWGYELTPDADDTTRLDAEFSSDNNNKQNNLQQDKEPQQVFESLSIMQRLRLVRSCIRAFEQAALRNPTFGDEKEAQYRRDLVQQLTYQQRLEFEQTFALLDKNNDGTIKVDELRALMDAFGKHHYQEADLAEMLNKANPDIDGNHYLSKEDFLALMAQAEFSSMFLETFKLLDPLGLGFLEAEQLWRVLDTLLGPDAAHHGTKENNGSTLTNFQLNHRHLAKQFGLDDGNIDYGAFVKILLSSSGSSFAPDSADDKVKHQREEATPPPPSSTTIDNRRRSRTSS